MASGAAMTMIFAMDVAAPQAASSRSGWPSACEVWRCGGEDSVRDHATRWLQRSRTPQGRHWPGVGRTRAGCDGSARWPRTLSATSSVHRPSVAVSSHRRAPRYRRAGGRHRPPRLRADRRRPECDGYRRAVSKTLFSTGMIVPFFNRIRRSGLPDKPRRGEARRV